MGLIYIFYLHSINKLKYIKLLTYQKRKILNTKKMYVKIIDINEIEILLVAFLHTKKQKL